MAVLDTPRTASPRPEPVVHPVEIIEAHPAEPPPLPVPAALPEPAPSTGPLGTLLVEGDGQVDLIGPDGQKASPGRVPAGRWSWTSHFGAQPGPSGSVQVPVEGTAVVRCSSFARHCRAFTR